MEGEQSKIDYLQQIAGSSMVGNTKESMFIFEGNGSNGKSKFVEMLSKVFGKVDEDGYKVSVKPEIFTGNTSNPEYYLAKLKGARLILMSETSNDGILNDTLIKQIVDSEEGISARPIRGEPFEFAVVGTVIMLTNNIPKVIVTDEGTWRRLSLVKFNRTFGEQEKDRNIARDKLDPEMEGILKWCVDGAIKYINNGQKVIPPNVIVQDTMTWRGTEDKLGTFIEEEMVNDGGTTKLSDILKRYTAYCITKNQYAGSEKELKKQFISRNFRIDKSGHGGTVRVLDWSLVKNSKSSDPEEMLERLAELRNKHVK
jgi:putative DNA primase/helicase